MRLHVLKTMQIPHSFKINYISYVLQSVLGFPIRLLGHNLEPLEGGGITEASAAAAMPYSLPSRRKVCFQS